MRAKCNPQRGLDFSGSHLKITNEYYARYEAVSTVLDQAPRVLDLVHKDLERALDCVNHEHRGRRPEVTGQTTALLTIRSISDRIGSSAKRSFQRRGVNAATSLAG